VENFRLKVFRIVAKHLNFSRAAEELLLTQPAVTQQIKALESELGASLFDRTGGRISLTAAGRTLLPYAERLKSLCDEGFEAVSQAVGQVAGELAVGASQTIGQYLLPTMLAAFLRDHSRVTIAARSGNSDAMLDALAERSVHLALIEGPALRRDVHTEPFMDDHLVLIVPESHEWADQDIPLSSLASAPLIIREFGSGSRRVIEAALAREGLDRKSLNIRMELDSTEGLVAAVEAGLGIAFVSRWAVRNQLALGTLKLARVRALKLSRQFLIAYPAGTEPNGAAGLFRRFLLANAEELAPRRRR
jgi:LysR family transcriptional regulator, transcriptional activator of the cysJI operon